MSRDEFLRLLNEHMPEACTGIDNIGQIIVYTGMMLSPDRSQLVPLLLEEDDPEAC